jgi:hypothetical protein
LTPLQHHRYSSLNLCQALSSLGRIVVEIRGGGTLLVNQADSSPVVSWELAPSSFSSRLLLGKHPRRASATIVTVSTIVSFIKEFSVA